MKDSPSVGAHSAWQLAGLYLLFGVPWIVATDAIVSTTVGGSAQAELVQVLKGLLFVAGTSVFIYVLARRRDERLAANRDSLRRTRNRLQSIIDASPVPIIALDTDGTVTLWNTAAEDTFGWTEADTVGGRPKWVPEDSEDEFEEYFSRVRDGESLDGIGIRRRTKTGEQRHFSLSAAPITDTDGDFTGVMAVLLDITGRKRRERNLVRYKRLMEKLPLGIFQTDPKDRGQFTEANPELLSLFGAESLDELAEHTIEDFYVDESERDDLIEQFERGETATVETKLSTLDDDVFWARVIGVQHVDEDGNLFVDGIVEDVTESRKQDRQFEVIERILRHNFRNALTVILGHVESLQYSDDVTDSESLDRITSQAERLLELSETERVIVKLLSGEIQPLVQDLSGHVASQVEDARARFPDATIEVEFPPDCSVTAVPQIEDAIGELLENAIVHADADPSLKVIGERTAETVVTRIEDTGPGIPSTELAEFRLDQPMDQLVHGSGLHLWLVYWAVTASDGTISFEKNTPRGTAVTIELPRSEPEG